MIADGLARLFAVAALLHLLALSFLRCAWGGIAFAENQSAARHIGKRGDAKSAAAATKG